MTNRSVEVERYLATLDDPSGLLVWRGPDRAVVAFADEAAIAAQQDAVVALVNAWVRT